MIQQLKENLWGQFAASIDMLDNAIRLCPDDLFNARKKFFYVTYHTLVFLDYYLTIPAPERFSSPFPFTENGAVPEDGIDDIVPDRFYTKGELLNYLQSSRKKCHDLIADLTEERLNLRFTEPGHKDYALLEILMYNMRHVQHHAAQLNMILRREIGDAPKWVGKAKDNL